MLTTSDIKEKIVQLENNPTFKRLMSPELSEKTAKNHLKNFPLLKGGYPMDVISLLVTQILQAKKGRILTAADSIEESKLFLELISATEIPSAEMLKQLENLARQDFSLETAMLQKNFQDLMQKAVEKVFGFEESRSGLWVTIVDGLTGIACLHTLLQKKEQVIVEDVLFAYTNLMKILE